MAQLLHGLKANAERGAHDTGQHDCQCGVLLTGTEQGGEGWGRDTWNGGDARSRGGAGTRESRKTGYTGKRELEDGPAPWKATARRLRRMGAVRGETEVVSPAVAGRAVGGRALSIGGSTELDADDGGRGGWASLFGPGHGAALR
jgi:hypothetical protein